MVKNIESLTRNAPTNGEDYSQLNTQVGIGQGSSDLILVGFISLAAAVFVSWGLTHLVPSLPETVSIGVGFIAALSVAAWFGGRMRRTRLAREAAAHRAKAIEREAEVQRQIAQMNSEAETKQ